MARTHGDETSTDAMRKAVAANAHHSEQIHEHFYCKSLMNCINGWQAQMLGWEKEVSRTSEYDEMLERWRKVLLDVEDMVEAATGSTAGRKRPREPEPLDPLDDVD